MDRPRSKGEKTKALIAEKAKVIFEQKGYVGTSMEDIREFSEISKGSIYQHFKSKEELFLYTVEKTSEIWRTGWEEHSKKVETSTEKLHLLAEYHASDMQLPLSHVVPEYIAAEDTDDKKMDHIRGLVKPGYDVFRQIIDEGMNRKTDERLRQRRIA